MAQTRALAAMPAPGNPPAPARPSTKQGEPASLDEAGRVRRFEQIFSAHLDAAYDFARWLTRDERNAEDVTQEACLRAFKSLDTFHGGNGRAWLLAIVRNTYYTMLRKTRAERMSVSFDDETMAAGELAELESTGSAVDLVLQQRDARRLVNAALEELPEEFREVIVLRELEDLSYKEIAAIAGIPLGTVMSRLARARKLLLQRLQHAKRES
ncbi:MAG TPA: sigma-70 family RNA polymerase sigma factor [Burkholderiales bacterium]|nr:sigma-70 family RNA polymerase sigma factor [Burkholderiales bacterium]